VEGKRRDSKSQRAEKFPTLEDVQAYLRVHGLHSLSGMESKSGVGKSKNHAKDKVIDKKDILALCLWASLSPLPTYAGGAQRTPIDRQSAMAAIPVVSAHKQSGMSAVQAAMNAESGTPFMSVSGGASQCQL